ncbi:MAG: U32 family peptidase [Pedosphaera sp.]|nr:U32 family peptidase [Pedosphaera sp.]
MSIPAQTPAPSPPAGVAVRLPELLAPAGDWECARAAVENGADAIYFGLDRFNARMRAHNFSGADLPRLMHFLHRRGVRGYVTFNTLVFPDELSAATDLLRTIIAAGVDAAIVQDVGICRLIRRLSPDFPIHASTQMTVTSVAGVEFVRELGCELVVLARENSLREIRTIREAMVQSGVGAPTLLEVFVHGALCVAYSGQCLTSEALGGRSANRGECAQACRMPYELISDGHLVPLGDRRYLLSPQDLAGLGVLPDLAAAGVSSLKIEGRLKSAEYVASITRVYRKALDAMGSAGGDSSRAGVSSGTRVNAGVDEATQYEMEMAFSRGLYPGWFRGINNQELAHARFGKKRGVRVGEVVRLDRDRVSVRLSGPVKPGDGLVFDAGRPDQPEQGGRVYEVFGSSAIATAAATAAASKKGAGEVVLTFGHDAIDWSQVNVGDRVWKTSDPQLTREVQQTFAGEVPRFQRPVDVEVHGRAGGALTTIFQDREGRMVQVKSHVQLESARKSPLTLERLRDQLGRLGGTPFQLGILHNHLEGDVILPVSELNRIRREAVAQLEALRSRPLRWTLRELPDEVPLFDPPAPPVRISGDGAQSAQLTVLVRDLAQMDAAATAGVQTVYCDFEDPKKYRAAVVRFHEIRGASACSNPGSPEADAEVFVAPPRITKPGEEWILRIVRSSDADGYLVRNYDHLKYFSECRKIGDYSFNVANQLTAEYFKQHCGLERITASYDLNSEQLESLFKAAPAEWFELTIHQHMPMFHMEHCVYCAFLSTGTDYTNCGRPCDRHAVSLRDRVGVEHPLKADAGCRNTVFNARAQTGAEHVDRFLNLGVRRFRLEFVNETPAEVRATIVRYRALLRGELSGTRLWQELKLVSQLGVTRGQMELSGERKVFPKETARSRAN